MSLSFNEYQQVAKTTAIYNPDYKVIYPALGLAGESGEVAEKVKKFLRDDNGVMTDERRQVIMAEVSDVLWYIAAICSDLDLKMGDVAQFNLNKLARRKEQGTLSGNGDNR
jgi:NTP pyrophosphatase (non-canonical NTP hydrolase)